MKERRVVAVVLLLILAIYALEAHARQRERPSPAVLGDQSAYLSYARNLQESHYTVIGDRNRMPVYPFLLSLIYKPGMSDEEFLGAAQTFTINLSIVLLVLLFFILRRFFSSPMALGLVAATAFGSFLYRAGKAQAELLFYFVSFSAFVLLLWMFVRPRWWLALLAGAVTGVAHLTKASILPALGIWVLVFGVEACWSWRENGGRRRLAMLALTAAAFLAVVFPYLQTSKRIYGAYFYNVNSTFVMWCDSSTEAFEFLLAHRDTSQLRSLPADQLPSFRKYWREHSVGQIAGRIIHGSADMATKNMRLIAYYKFGLAVAVAVGILAALHASRARAILATYPFAAAFCVLFFAGYFLLYAWYSAITTDTRFVLSMFLPFVFAGSLFACRLGHDSLIRIGSRRVPFDRFFGALLVVLAAIDAVYALPMLF